MENNKIKKEIEQETDEFMKALQERDSLKGSDFDVDIYVTASEMEKLIEESNDSSKQALRYNQGKPKWSLVDWKSLEGLVEVLQYGADKYTIFQDNEGNEIKGIDIMNIPNYKDIYKIKISGENNWKKGLKLKSILDSAMRHLVKMMNDEFVDEESKLLHAHHIICNMMFWVYFYNKK